jgi:hypothetical protein
MTLRNPEILPFRRLTQAFASNFSTTADPRVVLLKMPIIAGMY